MCCLPAHITNAEVKLLEAIDEPTKKEQLQLEDNMSHLRLGSNCHLVLSEPKSREGD
jgi:hypothetical protein